MRMRSPRMAPPVMRLVGSTAMIATVLPWRRRASASASTSVLLPAPGGPVMPTMRAWPAQGASSARVRRLGIAVFDGRGGAGSARASPERILRAQSVITSGCDIGLRRLAGESACPTLLCKGLRFGFLSYRRSSAANNVFANSDSISFSETGARSPAAGFRWCLRRWCKASRRGRTSPPGNP